MATRKPEVDEFLMHYRNMVNTMKRKKRILLYGLSGEGKSTLMRKLEEKYASSGWRFYHYGQHPIDNPHGPFVWELIDPDTPVEHIPEFDVIYCMQYSDDYKESLTGVYFPTWKPMREYIKEMKWQKSGRINIAGRKPKSIEELRRIINGEV